MPGYVILNPMKKLLFVFALAFLLAACGKDEVKPPSEDSELALESFKLADSIRSHYVNRELEAIKDLSTETGYGELKPGLREFDSAELKFTPRLVQIEDSTVTLNISWEGRWTLKGNILEEKGMAVFELLGKPLKLNRILKGSPFVYP